ncbi:pimeloyl-ACP methyl ester carboxylesterase [Oikeobacillus pervagus]|uniref:Pimeloyl-ACP methyl ester carboxylesterase n=1 Tax=Oikeobacillus pervagus TaxID=1325931 RepID=A0AAJ1SZ38_9BACI|nr:alpha/beta hydrolase [Oikeobacillus pervagus]MDQ0214362.1 pimeloyl-ACP methyl ester carboxylesterase [Oikeobacillus pervagus]
MEYIEKEGYTLCYEAYGKGSPIVFIHPPGMGRKTFIKQLSLQLNMKVVLLDLRGHGDSTISSSAMLDDFVEDIETVRNHLGVEKIFLFGYSAGGMIAQEYTFRFPRSVKGVILSGAYPIIQNKILEWEHRIGIFMAKSTPKILARILAVSHFSNDEEQQLIYNQIVKSNQNVWSQYYEMALNYSCIHKLNDWNIPLCLLYGKRADYINGHVKWYYTIPNVQIEWINKANHQLPTRHYRRINPIIEAFVNKHE